MHSEKHSESPTQEKTTVIIGIAQCVSLRLLAGDRECKTLGNNLVR